ncbi:MAG: Plug domain-containing protein, partial [Desulfonauticus sp.]|nr:Plug domain-containing protein [Desulfonauticus sp.]
MKKVNLLFFLSSLFLLLCNTPIFGLDQDQETIKLEDITVKGEAIPYKFDPATVNVIDSKEIEDLELNRTSDILQEVPGVEIGNYNQGGVANSFSMRGFKSCGHGGDAAVYIDGIPLNEGESHA